MSSAEDPLVAARVPVLTPRQVAAFERDGFVVVPRFVGADGVAALSRWTDELAALPERPGRHWVYHEPRADGSGARVLSRIENFSPFHDGFGRWLTGPGLTGCVAQLLGDEVVLFKDKINFKTPGSGGFEPHQDVQAGWDRYAGRHVTVLVGIDATTPENGCLELAPGRHREGLIGDHWTPLGDSVPDDAYRACPTAPGDAVFFDSFVPHRSAPNRTDRPRRVLYVTYNARSAGDQRARYYADKHASYPPDCERDPEREYVYRV